MTGASVSIYFCSLQAFSRLWPYRGAQKPHLFLGFLSIGLLKDLQRFSSTSEVCTQSVTLQGSKDADLWDQISQSKLAAFQEVKGTLLFCTKQSAGLRDTNVNLLPSREMSSVVWLVNTNVNCSG